MRLRKDITLGNLLALPRASRGWCAEASAQWEMLRADGYEAVQAWDGYADIHRAGLLPLGMARAVLPQGLDAIARRHCDEGLGHTTLHLGTGFESDAEMDALAAATLEAQARHGCILLVETHRATATQDIWRTLRWVERFPELRFTADLSHWYTGHELIYGGEFEARSARLQPILERVRSVHGRVGNSGCLQTPLNRPGSYLAHYEALWTALCAGFQRHAQPGDCLGFAPELLPMAVGEPPVWLHYQQTLSHPAPPGDAWAGEPCDRYADAHALWLLMQRCWQQALAPQEAI